MSKIFKVAILPLSALRVPLHPLYAETDQERSEQANAVAAGEARPVLIDANAVVVDGVATCCALHENGIENVTVVPVGGASAKQIRALRHVLGVVPTLNDRARELITDLERLLDAGYPIYPFIAGVVEVLEALLESHGLPDAGSLRGGRDF
jgi:hypothetical protein